MEFQTSGVEDQKHIIDVLRYSYIVVLCLYMSMQRFLTSTRVTSGSGSILPTGWTLQVKPLHYFQKSALEDVFFLHQL